MLTNFEIEKFYNDYVAVNFSSAYGEKYLRLPFTLNTGKWKWEGKDLARIIAVLEFREFMLQLNRTFKHILTFNISLPNGDPELEYVKYEQRDNFNFQDDQIKYDLHQIDLPKKDYDFCMVNQTLEHLYNPALAIKNIYDHLAKGGIFYLNVPAMNIMHDTPFHFVTGFTPMGLGIMLQEQGFKILKIGQWGNKDYLKKIISTGWTDWKSLGRFATYNDANCPVITWCFVTK